jgi:hypothetical protein
MGHEHVDRCQGARCSTAINACHSDRTSARRGRDFSSSVRLDEVVRDLAVMRNSLEQLAAKQEQMAQNIAIDEVARDLAAMRNSVEQLAAKQELMAQNIATLQAAEQDIIQTRSSPPLSEPVSPPPRKKARRVAPPKLAAQSSSVPPPAFRPE